MILITKHKTFCEDAEQLDRFKDYILQHHQSWINHAKKLQDRMKPQDILFVMGYDMTHDFSMLAFSDNSGFSAEFSVGVPAVGTASAGSGAHGILPSLCTITVVLNPDIPTQI